MHIVGTAVGQFPFGQGPDALVGIQLRRVGRKVLDLETRMPAKKLAQRRPLVGLRIVQQDDERSSEMTQQMSKEKADSPTPDIVEAELVVQPEPLTSRADGDRRDDRYAIVTVPMTVDRGVPPWCPGANEIRDQEEPRFVEEDEVGTQPCSVFFTPGHRFFFQRPIALSSRSTARRSGVWALQPRPCIIRPT